MAQTCVCLNKWVNFTKDNFELQWSQWETLSLDKQIHLLGALEKKGVSAKNSL